MNRGWWTIAKPAWIWLALMLVIGCGIEPPRRPDAVQKPAAVQKPVVHFGMISRYNPVVMYEEYQPIMDYLTSQTPYHFELKLGKTYDDDVRFLEQGITQIASLGVITYLEAHARFGAVPILKALNPQGDPFYRSIIIVRQDSDIHVMADLKGRTFCFAAAHSTSSNLYGRYSLMQAGVFLHDLAKYENLKHHDQVAKAVLSGRYDAGAVRDIVAYRYEPMGLRFLSVSEPIPSSPIAIRADMPSELRQAVQDALLRLDRDNPEHRQLMAGWNEEFRYGFATASDGDYAPIRTMLNTIPGKCGESCHPALRF